MKAYIDTSALATLLTEEANSAAFGDWVRAHSPELVASELLVAELHRVARRRGSPPADVERLLGPITLLDLDSELIAEAGAVEAAPDCILGTLDALHLVTALRLVRVGARVDAVLTYDATFAESLRHHGFVVEAPGT